jgi:hypothetical protein
MDRQGLSAMSYDRPETPAEFMLAGWTYIEDGTCRGAHCGRRIQWWKTPGGKRTPLSETAKNGKTILVSHFSDCPDADAFRRGK